MHEIAWRKASHGRAPVPSQQTGSGLGNPAPRISWELAWVSITVSLSLRAWPRQGLSTRQGKTGFALRGASGASLQHAIVGRAPCLQLADPQRLGGQARHVRCQLDGEPAVKVEQLLVPHPAHLRASPHAQPRRHRAACSDEASRAQEWAARATAPGSPRLRPDRAQPVTRHGGAQGLA